LRLPNSARAASLRPSAVPARRTIASRSSGTRPTSRGRCAARAARHHSRFCSVCFRPIADLTSLSRRARVAWPGSRPGRSWVMDHPLGGGLPPFQAR
jgi:hypothetical protein